MNKRLDKPTLKKQPARVFLCHSHSDNDAAQALSSRLGKDDIEVWLDKKELLPGQDWQNEIRKAILKSDIVIVCISRGFNRQPGYRHKELKIALQKAKSLPADEIVIIPARLEKCDMPVSLRHLHRVDLFESDGYKKLISTLRKQGTSM